MMHLATSLGLRHIGSQQHVTKYTVQSVSMMFPIQQHHKYCCCCCCCKKNTPMHLGVLNCCSHCFGCITNEFCCMFLGQWQLNAACTTTYWQHTSCLECTFLETAALLQAMIKVSYFHSKHLLLSSNKKEQQAPP